MPTAREGRVTLWPAARISPALGGCVPRIARNSVDLPQPLGPTTATIWPSEICKFRLFSTLFDPNQCETASIVKACATLFSKPGAEFAAGAVQQPVQS